jgi:glycosyltransferase involved in cell wall biosynthesis
MSFRTDTGPGDTMRREGAWVRILYIYHEYYNRRGKYAEVMRGLGHRVDTARVRGKKRPNQIGLQHVRANYDIVWLLSGHYLAYDVITRSTVEAMKQSGAKLVAYTTLPTDTPLREWLEYYRMFDWLFFQHKESSEFLRENGVNAVYVPLGFHAGQYPLKQRPDRYDITFMGSPQTNVPTSEDLRVQLLNRLRGFNVAVFGKGFRGKLHPEIPIHGYSTHEKQVRIYSQSKINLDIAYINSALPEYRGKYHAKNRLFEVPATGNFLLTNDCPELRELIGDGACGFYQPDNLEEVVSYYLANDQLRKEIADRGHGVAQCHTFERRFKQMLDIIGSAS